jgi:hypothetical protein
MTVENGADHGGFAVGDPGRRNRFDWIMLW